MALQCPALLLTFLLAIVALTHCKECTAGSDCERSECCLLDKSTGQGICSPMRRTAWKCYMSQPYAWSRPEEMITNFDLCQCTTGEFCAPVHKYDDIYGEIGICTFG